MSEKGTEMTEATERVKPAQKPTDGATPTTEPTPFERLREPFPPERVGTLERRQRAGSDDKVQLSYVGHADVTDRLLSVDPRWDWTPVAWDADGLPRFVRDASDRPVGLWINLNVCGVSRLGFGSVTAGAFDAEKQLIGDAIRNAAMRFGVALDMWRKDESHQPEAGVADEDDYGPCTEHGCPGRLAAKVVKGNRIVECTEHGFTGKDGKRRGGKCTRETDWHPDWAWFENHRDRANGLAPATVEAPPVTDTDGYAMDANLRLASQAWQALVMTDTRWPRQHETKDDGSIAWKETREAWLRRLTPEQITGLRGVIEKETAQVPIPV